MTLEGTQCSKSTPNVVSPTESRSEFGVVHSEPLRPRMVTDKALFERLSAKVTVIDFAHRGEPSTKLDLRRKPIFLKN